MKKLLGLIFAAVVMLTPMTSFAAESTYPLHYIPAAEENDFSDALYDTEHSEITDWSDAVVWELSEDVPKLEDVDWKVLTDEALTEVINHSTYEEVGWFLLGLEDEEL